MLALLIDCLSVGAGAGIGAFLRALDLALFDHPGTLLTVNAIGAYLMTSTRPGKFLGTGVLGGFTSYSAMILTMHSFTPLIGAAYLVATCLICILAAWLGDRSYRARSKK